MATTFLRITLAFLLCVLSFLLGQSLHDAELARTYQQRDKAIEAVQSLGAAFDSLHKAFESMERTANKCIDVSKKANANHQKCVTITGQATGDKSTWCDGKPVKYEPSQKP
jgi:hypothetical protein